MKMKYDNIKPAKNPHEMLLIELNPDTSIKSKGKIYVVNLKSGKISKIKQKKKIQTDK